MPDDDDWESEAKNSAPWESESEHESRSLSEGPAIGIGTRQNGNLNESGPQLSGSGRTSHGSEGGGVEGAASSSSESLESGGKAAAVAWAPPLVASGALGSGGTLPPGSQASALQALSDGTAAAAALKASLQEDEKISSLVQQQDESVESVANRDNETPSVWSPEREDGNPFDFFPEPLHVRGLVQAARRSTTQQSASAVEELNKLLAELGETEGESEGATGTKAGRKVRIASRPHDEVINDIQRVRYRLKVLKRRRERLRALNPRTHAELPLQFVEAARDGDAEYVRLACEAKVNVDLQHELGTTALIAATIANRVSVVRTLVELEADPRIQDLNGATCAHYAVQLDHLHVLAAILDTRPGKNLDALTVKDDRGRSAIDYARCDEREAHRRLLHNRMGGPVPVVWQVFKGWVCDLIGVRGSGGACSQVVRAQPDQATIATTSPQK